MQKIVNCVRVKTCNEQATPKIKEYIQDHYDQDYGIVIDCPDTFVTRHIVNDACVLARNPLS